MGAIFGLAGIFVAACLYLFYALVKLVFLLATLAAQLIIYVYHQIRDRNVSQDLAVVQES